MNSVSKSFLKKVLSKKTKQYREPLKPNLIAPLRQYSILSLQTYKVY